MINPSDYSNVCPSCKGNSTSSYYQNGRLYDDCVKCKGAGGYDQILLRPEPLKKAKEEGNGQRDE